MTWGLIFGRSPRGEFQMYTCPGLLSSVSERVRVSRALQLHTVGLDEDHMPLMSSAYEHLKDNGMDPALAAVTMLTLMVDMNERRI